MNSAARCSLFGALLVLTSGGAASGAPIYAQEPVITQAFPSGFDYEVADDFLIGAGATVRSVTWQGSYTGVIPAADAFVIKFYDDDSGVPGNPLAGGSFTVGSAVNRTATGLVLAARDVFSYSADLGSGLALSANTPYWVAIFNMVPAEWNWGLAPGGTAAYTDGQGWMSTDAVMRFALHDTNLTTVAEPVMLTLFGPGIALLVLRRRRGSRQG
jgi:hypothetical protein